MTTFPLNLLYGLWCGGFLAACAGPRLHELGSEPTGKPASKSTVRAGRKRRGATAVVLSAWPRLLSLPLLFAALSVLPSATYLAAQFPDWTLMYLVDPQRLPRLWPLAAGLFTAAGVAVGFAAGVLWFVRVGGGPLKLALGGLLVVYLGLVLLSWRSGRLAEVGSFANFHAGGWLMQPLFSMRAWQLENRPFGLLYALLAINLCQALAFATAAHTLLTKSEFIFAKGQSPALPAPGNYWQS